MVNAQKWLDKHYPKEKRSEIKELDISSIGNLGGSLKLGEFSNLEKFRSLDNGLTELDLSECVKLRELSCSRNNLTNTGFLRTIPSPEKLTYLNIGNNDISNQDLIFLKQLGVSIWFLIKKSINEERRRKENGR